MNLLQVHEPYPSTKKKTYRRQYTTKPQTNEQTADYLFLEKFNKVTFRDFAANTRMNTNGDYEAQRVKRDRQISYWKNNVIQNFLPPISNKLKKASESKR